MSKVIEVVVIGTVGSGKSHVLSLIDKALRDSYGPHAQIVSRDLSMERGLGSPSPQPSADTIFSLKERGLVSGQIATNLKVELDTTDIDASIARVEALQGCASSFAADPLGSAIRDTVGLINDQTVFLAENNFGEVRIASLRFLSEKLNSHLNHLMDAQLSRLASQ